MTGDTLPAWARPVLSVFPGIDILGRAFEELGFCVLRGPDLIWGGDVRTFHPPTGIFKGVIGGPPCKAFSSFQSINKAMGRAPAANLIPEFERVVAEAAPLWFLMENVPLAPKPAVDGYFVTDYLFDNRWAGGKQKRRRRFSFGALEAGWKLVLEPALLEDPERVRTVTATDGRRRGCGYHRKGSDTFGTSFLSIDDALEAQGLPRGYLDHCPFTVSGKYVVVGNGVPLPMGRVFARAIAAIFLKAEALA